MKAWMHHRPAALSYRGRHAQDVPMTRLSALALPALLLLASIPIGDAVAADAVTIYRCTDASGKLTLRDTPCSKGQQQETRSMLRPKDGAPPASPVAKPPTPPAVPATTRVVVVSPPRPLYECITPDGSRYTSDTAEGNLRWVPLWTLGYPVYRGGGYRARTSGSIDIDAGNVRIHGGSSSGTGHPGPAYVPRYAAAGTWVRDSCHALPPREVCARLFDRRDEIRRLFFNAMPSERDVLRVEERGINARLDNDCGGS